MREKLNYKDAHRKEVKTAFWADCRKVDVETARDLPAAAVVVVAAAAAADCDYCNHYHGHYYYYYYHDYCGRCCDLYSF